MYCVLLIKFPFDSVSLIAASSLDFFSWSKVNLNCVGFQFDYEEEGKRVRCHCGARNCRGFMN